MNRYFFRFVVSLLMLMIGPAEATFAQTTVSQLQAELVAPWLVTVEGEARPRTLRILSLGEKAKDVFLVEAMYGWLDGRQDPALAELTLSPTDRKIVITTSVQSVILATQSTDGTFVGTFKPKTGTEKAVKLAKISEQDLQAKLQAALALKQAQVFADEDKDWGIAPTSTLRRTGGFHAPTPRTIPGAKVIKTMAFKALLETDKTVVVIDVLDGKDRTSIPGAYWMERAGEGLTFYAEKSRFSAALDKLTVGDKNRPLVFLCLSSECWLSYNASLQALEAGYKDVTWYRGGVNAWRAAGLPFKVPERVNW